MQSNDVKAVAVISKEAAYFGVPWEDAYGYAQAIKVGDAIHSPANSATTRTGT